MESIGDFEYSKKDLIGHGAFAVVFKGRHKKTEAIVAIKSITKKNLAKSQSLLSKEIKILKELSSLHHENVVGLLECKETGHHVYLVMEFCNGGDLADYLQVKGTLSEDTIASFLRQIAGAMRALNDKGIVHRDLKPQNILLCHSGQPNVSPKNIQLKIADFGFARFLQDGVMAATLCGSPMYMAPEVIMSLQYDAKADLWSVGTIVYQCLTGKAPFHAQTPQQLKQFYEKNTVLQPNIPSGTSRDLKDLLLGLLKRDARDRIQFDDFFNHPFLHPKPKVKASSPVPVPRSRLVHVSGSPPHLKAVSASPLSAQITPSSPVVKSFKTPPARQSDAVTSSVTSVTGFLNVTREETIGLSPLEDFVLVPDNIPSDHSVSSVGSAPLAHSPVDLNAIFSDNSADSPRQSARAARGASARKREEGGNEKSPSRPSSLLVNTPTGSPRALPSSHPMPVPSQLKAYEQIQRSTGGSPSSPLTSHTVSPPSSKTGVPIPRKSSISSIPSVGSISPPSVQFTIGTPPGAVWRKPSLGTPPLGGRPVVTPTGKSPLRRTCTSPALPTIVGSPTKLLAAAAPFRASPSAARDGAFAGGMGYRVKTCPDSIGAGGHCVTGGIERSESEGRAVVSHSCSSSRLSEQLVDAFGSRMTAPPPPPASPSLPAHLSLLAPSSPSLHQPPAVISFSTTGRQRTLSSGHDDDCVPSMPAMEGPVALVAPELVEETLMDKCHNETLAKLSFVLALVECVVELAQSRSSPISQSVCSLARPAPTPPGHAPAPPGHAVFAGETTRSIEQLVLYVRALQLLGAAMELARSEIGAQRLQPSSNVRTLISEMNNYYHECLCVCKYLRRNDLLSEPVDCQANITADKLIYTHAIEMCQTAALDELFGNPTECFRRYRSAQILLHSLAQQAPNNQDRQLLNKYRESVERRIFNLYNQEYISMKDDS